MPPSEPPRTRRSDRPASRWARRDRPAAAGRPDATSPVAASDPDVGELSPESPLRAIYRVPDKPRFVLIGLFGLDDGVTATCTDLADAEMRECGVIPVYVTDGVGVGPLRRKQRLFEVLPSQWASYQVAPDLDWSYYLRRRYLLLLEKWRPIGLVVFGLPPTWLPSAEAFDVPAGQSGTQPRPGSAAGPGVPSAITRLGVLMEGGAAGAPDFEAAAQLYRRACEQGDVEALHRLGRLYRDGKGVAQDDAEARRLLEAALEAGHTGVERDLAEIYEQGRGGPRNRTEALRLYQIAAEKDPWAARAVGRLYAASDRIASDASEAIRWFRKAAFAGIGWAAWDLARLYEAGRATEPMPGEVARWYGVALAQGATDPKLQELARQRLEALPPATLAAGAQLLLKEVGYDIDAADGVPGPRIQEALRSFFANSSTIRTDVTPEMLVELATHWHASR